MKSLSRVGLGLSVVFTCLLLALVAEIYYLLWWKRRIIKREIKDDNPARKELSFMFCCKKQSKSSVFNESSRTPDTRIHYQSSGEQEFQFQPQNDKDYFAKSLDDNGALGTELMITGPPRFLFTINEETREDLESEDGKSREGKRSLSDLLMNVENTPPYLTPLCSPPYLTPMGSCHSTQSGSGYNPFFEASTDAEFNKIVKASPPSKFKFLRDAEDKLQKKLMLMEQAKVEANLQTTNGEKDGSFITVIVDNNKENDDHYHTPHSHSGDSPSCSSEILPSASSNKKFKSFLIL